MKFSHKLISNLFDMTKRDVIVIIINFAISIILTRSLGLEKYSNYLLILLIPLTAETFMRLKFDYSSIFLVSKKFVNLSEIFFFQMVYNFFATLIFFLVIFLSKSFLLKNINFEISPLLFALIIFLFLMRIFHITFSYFFLQTEKYSIYNKIILFNSLGNIIFLYILLIIFSYKNIEIVFISSCFSLLTINIFSLFYFLNNYSIKPFFDFKKYELIIKFSMKHYFVGIFDYLILNMHQYIITIFFNHNLLALTNLAKSISEMIIKPFSSTFSNIFYSELSKKEKKTDHTKFIFSFKIYFILTIFIFLISIIIIEPFVIFIYGNEFKEISKYYFLIAPSIILLSYTYIFYSYFSSIGRQDIFLTYISISFLVYIIAFLLIYKFLFEYSIFLSFMLSSFFLTIFLLKKLFDINKLKYDQIILNSRDIKLFIKISKRYAKKIL